MDVSNSSVQLNTSDGKMDAYVAQPKVEKLREYFGDRLKD